MALHLDLTAFSILFNTRSAALARKKTNVTASLSLVLYFTLLLNLQFASTKSTTLHFFPSSSSPLFYLLFPFIGSCSTQIEGNGNFERNRG